MRRLLGLWLALALLLGCNQRPPYEGRSVAELEQMLSDSNSTVRAQGAYGLSLHGAEARSAVPALMKALESDDTLLRTQAALALGRVGPDARDAVPALAKTLGDSEWSVRRQAVVALGQIGPNASSTASFLHRLHREDPNGLVRKAAEQALRRIEP